jgi:hypothetical protein
MIRFPAPSTFLSITALVISLSEAAFSATGGNFILGLTNSASTQTRLVTPLNAGAFRVDNVSTGASAAGIVIATDARRPPLVITSSTKVAKLNADQLDGIDSAEFVRGIADGQAIALSPSTTVFLGPSTGLLRFRYQCPASLASNGAFRIVNASTTLTNLFIDSGGANPDFFQLGSGGFVDYPAAAGGESFSIQAQGVLGVQTALAATVHRSASNDCHAQVLTMLAP